MKTLRSIWFTTLLCLGACEEHDELIVIAPDGKLEVVVEVRGEPKDLVEGYSIPLAPPWVPEGEETLRWLELVGPDSGSVASQANLEHWTSDKAALRSRARFAAAEHLPRTYAPLNEPYGDTHLARTTGLEVRRAGSRSVYLFERRYGARRHADLSLSDDLEKLPKELLERISDIDPLSDEQWGVVQSTVERAFLESAASFATEALTPIYTEGDATLGVRGFQRVLADVRAASAELVSLSKLKQLYAVLSVRDAEGEADARDLDPEEALRSVLRETLARSLAQVGVEPATRNAVLHRLERAFADFDHTTDLDDCKFKLTVEFPAPVVTGNYDELEADGRRAVWRFDGGDLHDRERLLSAIALSE